MNDDEDEIDTDTMILFSIEHKIKIVRVMNTLLVPSYLDIRAGIGGNMDVHSIEGATMLVKIKTWLKDILDGVIVFSAGNTDAYQMFFDDKGMARTSNPLMMTPGEPTDDILALVFAAKFGALSGNEGTIEGSEVRSDNPLGLCSTFIGNTNVILPTMEDWIGNVSYFDEPWWNRDDISSYDITPLPGADLSVKPAWARPFSIKLGSMFTEPNEEKPETATVIRPNFRARVIEGGKKPDA